MSPLIAPIMLLQAGFGVINDPTGFGAADLPILGFVKILFILAFALYAVFAFVVTRQISIMRRTLITTFSPILRTMGYLHFIVSVVVFLIFLIIL